MTQLRRVYCLAEDRVANEVGLRIAVASLMRSCPTSTAVVYYPNPSQDFRRWVEGYPRVTVVPELPAGAYSWNCKPHTLLPLLEDGADEAVWLDSDILVARDPSYLFDAHPPDVLIGAEEPHPAPLPMGWHVRTRPWGLDLGRDSPVTLNSCVLRVTKSHIPLLKEWRKLLARPDYVAAQTELGLQARPVHMWGDQDVLNALLGSKEFEGVSVHYLRIGRDLIHCGGALVYNVSQRVGGLGQPIPPFLHSMSGKPWWVLSPAYRKDHSRWFTFYRRLLQEVSPYVAEARRFRDEVGLPCPWLDVRSFLGATSRLLGFGHFALRGLPLTAAATVLVAAKQLVRGRP